MGHELVKSDLLTEETVQEMKFCKKNFFALQELVITQIREIKTLVQQHELNSKNHKNNMFLLSESQSVSSHLDKTIQLRDKKISILKKKVKYLKFRRVVEGNRK